MPAILDLPFELLDHIILLIPGSDILSFALCNKTIHLHSKGALERHLTLRKHYSVLKLGSADGQGASIEYDRPGPRNDAFLLLANIIEDPDVALYPKALYLGYCFDDSDDSDYLDEDEIIDENLISRRQSVITKYSTELEGLVERCEAIPPEDKESFFGAICRPYNEAAALSLLLTILPSLNYIKAYDWRFLGKPKWFDGMMERIVKANMTQSSIHAPLEGRLFKSCIHPCATFSNLQELYMANCDPKGAEPLEQFLPFALLPSIRKLSGWAIDGDKSFEWPYHLGSGLSPITEIDFSYSAIDANAFDSLLSGMPYLRKFKYEHGGANVGNAFYNPTRYILSLQKYAPSTLELLHISGMPPEHLRDMMDEIEGLPPCVESFKMFTSLENIRLEDIVFMDQYEVSSKSTSFTGTLKRLADVLPASVKSLALLQTLGDEPLRHLLDGLADVKSETLPNLENIRLECKDPLDNDMREALTTAGIKLKIRYSRYPNLG